MSEPTLTSSEGIAEIDGYVRLCFWKKRPTFLSMAKPRTNNSRKNNRLSAEPWEVEYFHHQLPKFSQEELSHVI